METTRHEVLEARTALSHALSSRGELASCPSSSLRDLVTSEREKGRAFGFVAEAARHELARRGEQA